MNTFENELRALINRYSKENGSNTPDFILANYLMQCLDVFGDAMRDRDKFYGLKTSIVTEVHDEPRRD